MEFSTDSGLVQVWVGLVRSKAYRLDQVPALFNLQEMVEKALEQTTQPVFAQS